MHSSAGAGLPLCGDDRGRDRRYRGGGAVRRRGHQLLRAVLARRARRRARRASPRTRCAPPISNLRPAGPATWSVLWKVPALGQSLRLRVDARLPEECAALAPRRAEFVADAYVERWSVRCPAGLAGGVIRFDGLSALRDRGAAAHRAARRTGRHHRARHAGGADLRRPRRAFACGRFSKPICRSACTTSCSARTTCSSCSACC